MTSTRGWDYLERPDALKLIVSSVKRREPARLRITRGIAQREFAKEQTRETLVVAVVMRRGWYRTRILAFSIRPGHSGLHALARLITWLSVTEDVILQYLNPSAYQYWYRRPSFHFSQTPAFAIRWNSLT
jgi:hypothetical protein